MIPKLVFQSIDWNTYNVEINGIAVFLEVKILRSNGYWYVTHGNTSWMLKSDYGYEYEQIIHLLYRIEVLGYEDSPDPVTT